MPCRPVPDHDELRTGGERCGSHATGRRELSLQAHTTGRGQPGCWTSAGPPCMKSCANTESYNQRENRGGT